MKTRVGCYRNSHRLLWKPVSVVLETRVGCYLEILVGCCGQPRRLMRPQNQVWQPASAVMESQ
eukprot:7515187-Pyramimonas_sp.AAC.1